MRMVRGLAAWSALAVLAVSQTGMVAAQSVEKPAKPAQAAEKKKDPSVALKAYDAGTRAFEAGKYDPAIKSLSAALSAGGLPSQQMAKALYYRGAAYRKQGKPAQAISDLTTAAWLKGGLSDADRAQALDQRQAAYREAGLGEAPAAIVEPRTDAASQQVAAAAPGQGAVQSSTPVSSSSFKWPWESSQPAAPAAAPPAETPAPAAVAIAPVPAPIPTTAPSPAPVAVPFSAPVVDASPAPDSVAVAMAPTASASPTETSSGAPNTLEKTGKAITGFFGNMFGGSSGPDAGSQATQTSSSAVITSSTNAAAASPNGWSQGISVASSTSNTAPQAPAASATPRGKYRLQVAAVRSRDEADRLAQRLAQSHGARLGGRTTEVDEAVIGNMGTFYRVRIGPYADGSEPNQLCTVLRPDGFDCLVVMQ